MFVLFLELGTRTSHLRNWAESSHMNPRRNLSQSPGSCEEALNVKVTKFVGAVFLSDMPNLNGVSLVSTIVPVPTCHMSILQSLM